MINSDDAFEHQLKKANLSLKMPASETEPRDIVRARAKQTTASRKAGYLEGRLGIIIDGTGRDYDKIAKEATQLQQLGYDTYMIFVNTSLDVALIRNAERSRSVPEPIVTQSWKDVQKNIGKFSNLFKNRFIIVDNNDPNEPPHLEVFKRVKQLANKKVTNGIAKRWIANELERQRSKWLRPNLRP